MGITDDIRSELLAGLAQFTRAEPERFVSSVLVTPTREHFPDEWTRSEDGLRAIGDRLLSYAGLDGYSLEIALDDEADHENSMLPATALSLAGIEGRVVHLSVTTIGLHEDAVFALTHEVARAALLAREVGRNASAYRDVHQDPDEFVEAEEDDELAYEASILAVHLGLGLVAAHGAHVYRQAGKITGSVPRTEWQHLRYGALPPDAASYLLAVHLVARGVDDETLEPLLAALPDQRRIEVKRERAALDRATLVETLGLPSPESWSALARPVEPRSPAPAKTSKLARKPKNVAFRVREDDSTSGGGIGFGLGAAAVTVMLAAGAVSMPLGLVVLWGPAVAGWWMGRSRRWFSCSECGRRIAEGDEICSRCAHPVVGEIASRNEILDARERWEQRAKSTLEAEHSEGDGE